MGFEQKLIKVLQSLVVDIEAMKNREGFGPFESYTYDGDGVSVEWPNLDILLAEAKELVGDV